MWPSCAVVAVGAAVFGRGLLFRFWYLPSLFFLGLTLAFAQMDTRCRVLREGAAETHRATFHHALTIESEPIFRGKEKRTFSFLTTYSHVALRVIAPLPGGEDLPQVGEVWDCAGWLDTRGDATDLRPRRLWIKGRGTFARCIALPHSLRGTFARIRHDFSRRMGIGLEHSAPDIANLNRAILLGERAGLARDIRDTFIRAGTLHVFAISGLHVMIIAQLLMALLVCCAIPIRFSGLLLIPLLWAYTYLIGMTPSAIRAAGMASFYFGASIFMRRPNGIIAWCLTFLVIHIFDPLMLLNVGCELSFAVMLGILLSLRFCAHFNFGRAEGLIVTLAAWLAGTPLAAHVFGRITPGGILANLFLIPTAAVSVISSALGILSSFISATLAGHINNAAALFTRAMVGISWAVSHLPGSNFETSRWSVATCLIYYTLFLVLPAFLIFLRHRRRVL